MLAALAPLAPPAAFGEEQQAAELSAPAAPAQKEKPEKKEPKAPQKVTFNFVDVELGAVAKFVSDITGKNFIFDDRIKGKITIIAPSKLSVEDAYSLFTSVLRLKGFTIVPSGIDAYKILPAAEARQSGVEISTDRPPVNENYVARLIPLTYIAAEDGVRFLQPVISRDGHISSFGPGNLILVVDSGLNIDRILSLVDAIDKPSAGEEPEVVLLKYAAADTVAKIVNDGLARPGKPAPAQGKAVADPRLNAVILFGDAGPKEAMKKLIALLDMPLAGEQGAINVYFLENADATELSKVLDSLIKGQPGKPAVSPIFDAPITMTPDKATNSLVIVAPPSVYQNLLGVVKQLDRKRRQVFVEAMIVEASLEKLRELGTKWRVVVEDNGEPIVVGGVGTIDSTALSGIVSGLSGLTVGGMGNFLEVPLTKADGSTSALTIPGFAALFALNDFKGAVNVLSTPQILTSDNIQAEIVVGENVPFVSKIERGLTAGDQTPFSSVERKDVGITLRITPQITEGGYVKLEMYQEISSVKKPVLAAEETLFTTVGPTTTKRSTKTTVVVKDEQTVVIGGLMQEKQENTITKVPLLGDIPILGWLFKSKSASQGKTNLLVFLTPHIIKEADDLEGFTEKKQREFAAKEKEYVEGELLVKFKSEVTPAEAEALIKEKGASVIKAINEVYLIRLKKGRSVESGIKTFKRLKEVELAEPNYRVKALQ